MSQSNLEPITKVARASNVHLMIAHRAFPGGAGAVCPSCGKSRLLTVEETAECLVVGWPWCCGQRMQIESVPELMK